MSDMARVELHRDEAGAVAVVVAIFVAVVALAAAALAFDLGSLWQSQRALVTDSDAMTLAGAVVATEQLREDETCPTDQAVEDEVLAVRDDNNVLDDVEDIFFACDADTFSGTVQVQVRQPSDAYFSGNDNLSAFQTTTVSFEFLIQDAEGLAVCRQVFFDDDFRNSAEHLAIPYSKAKETIEDVVGATNVCPVTSPPSNNSASQTAGGWGGLTGACSLSFDGDNWCDGATGTNASLSLFDDLIGQDKTFPVFEEATGQGSANGPNGSRFRIVGFITGEVLGTCKDAGTGTSAANPQNCAPPYATGNNAFNGQPEFIMVDIDDDSFVGLDDPNINLFSDSQLSICDVEVDRARCPVVNTTP